MRKCEQNAIRKSEITIVPQTATEPPTPNETTHGVAIPKAKFKSQPQLLLSFSLSLSTCGLQYL